MSVSEAELSRNAKRQLRVPAGNGPRSGRWLNDPRTQASELAERLAKRGSVAAKSVSAIAAGMKGLSPSSPDWFGTLTTAADGLRALRGLPLEDAEAVEALAEEMDFLMLADWSEDFDDLGFDEDWADVDELGDFSEWEPQPVADSA